MDETQKDKVASFPVRRRGRPFASGVAALDEHALLELAFRTFAERGYEATTLRHLSERLGVSHNLLHVRFGRKAELWKRAVDWRLGAASSTVTPVFEEAADEETRLRHLIRRFCHWTTEYPDIVGLSHLEGRRDTWRIAYIADRFIIPFQRRLDELLRAVAVRRPVTPISTVALMALLVHGVGSLFATAPLQRALGAGADVEPVRAPQQADLMAEFLLAALLPTRGLS